MTGFELLELQALAERYCREVLLDLPAMTDAERRGVLIWLRGQGQSV